MVEPVLHILHIHSLLPVVSLGGVLALERDAFFLVAGRVLLRVLGQICKTRPRLVVPKLLQQGQFAGCSLLGPVVVHSTYGEGGVAGTKVLRVRIVEGILSPMLALCEHMRYVLIA